MTKNTSLQGSRSSSREFLFFTTDTTTHTDYTDDASSADLNRLEKEFPNMPVGSSFIRTAMARLESNPSKFAAMVVRIDSRPRPEPEETPVDETGGENSENKQTALLLDVAKALHGACEGIGVMGLLTREIFACLFPETDEKQCPQIADNIRKNLALRRQESLTVGIASYPFLHFSRERILENACKALEHAAFLGPGGTAFFDAVSLNISGDRLYQEGNIHGAIAEFKTALLIDPANVNVHNSLGVCYGVRGEFEEALEKFEIAMRLDPAEMMAIYNAGLVNMFRGKQKKALEYFLRAESLGEEVFEVAFQLGRLYAETGAAEKGRHFLEKAVRLRHESGPAIRYLGECYASLNMSNEALRAYKKAVRLNPFDAASLSAIGYLFDVQGENPEIATVFCQHSVEISPENGLFRHRLGLLYLKQNRLDDALKEFMKALELGHHDSIQLIEDIQTRRTAAAS
ncbi:MAG: hypothetical protein BWK80_40490 [Desulfobacteraceae bacterium IS3]|nr:MAG: hypothetical protein BWK80_40490 [Desulfobacteraceae bacterium IS3]